MELKKQGISIPIVKEFLFKKICQVEGPQEGAHMVLKYQFNNPDIFDDAVRDALNQLVYAFFMGA